MEMKTETVTSQKSSISIEEFLQMLENHDWYHIMSDDDRVFQRGQKQLEDIRKHISDNELFEQMFKDKYRSVWKQ